MRTPNVNSTKTLTKEVLIKMLERAVHAPSGDNSQPWRFIVSDNTITLLNIPNADATLYNFKQRGSFFAHGAVIENLSLLAEESGFRMNAELFPAIPGVTAQISFSPIDEIPSPLAAAIELRSTNRKAYKDLPLHSEDREDLLKVLKDNNVVTFKLTDKEEVNILAQTVSLNEQLLMENRTLHDFLFGIIRWTKKEEEETPGLYLKTMELPPPVQLLFRYVFKYWNAVELLNHVGLSHFIPKQSAPVYTASSAFGAIILNRDTDADFVAAGRAFQRVWLTATTKGMYMQPVTAIPYLLQRVVAGAANDFSPHHQELIRDAGNKIGETFHLKGSEHIAMLFRIGYGDKPSAISSKALPILVDE